jgi:hypothetical protein
MHLLSGAFGSVKVVGAEPAEAYDKEPYDKEDIGPGSAIAESARWADPQFPEIIRDSAHGLSPFLSLSERLSPKTTTVRICRTFSPFDL